MSFILKIAGHSGKLIVYILIVIIKIYQNFITALLHPSCRYYPSCSRYSIDALNRHGVFKGIFLSVKRIISCNPWKDGGYDPVPDTFRLFK